MCILFKFINFYNSFLYLNYGLKLNTHSIRDTFSSSNCPFLIGREISLWYFKINDLIELLKSNNQLLTEIRDFLKPKETGIKGIEKTYDNIKGEGDLNDPEVLEGLMKRVKTKE